MEICHALYRQYKNNVRDHDLTLQLNNKLSISNNNSSKDHPHILQCKATILNTKNDTK